MNEWIVEYEHFNSGYPRKMQIHADDVRYCMGALTINKDIIIKLLGVETKGETTIKTREGRRNENENKN